MFVTVDDPRWAFTGDEVLLLLILIVLLALPSCTHVKPETACTPNLVIRRGETNDATLLAEVGERTFSETFAADNSPEDMAAYLASSFSPEQQAAELADPHCLFQIAETDGVPVGYAMLRSGSALDSVTGDDPIELVRLYVTKDSIGTGAGAALMQACIAEAKQRGYKTLWLGVWEHNHRAQAFYRKWNFLEVGTHGFQLGEDLQTDILMQRSMGRS